MISPIFEIDSSERDKIYCLINSVGRVATLPNGRIFYHSYSNEDDSVVAAYTKGISGAKLATFSRHSKRGPKVYTLAQLNAAKKIVVSWHSYNAIYANKRQVAYELYYHVHHDDSYDYAIFEYGFERFTDETAESKILKWLGEMTNTIRHWFWAMIQA